MLGAFLVLFGIGWLLQSLDGVEVPWRVLVPSALIVVGIALVIVARAGRSHGGLIALGIVLTVLLAVGTAIDLPLGGGIGERREHPTTAAAVKDDYRLAIGSMTIDLSEIQHFVVVGDEPAIAFRARVGIGELIVIVPKGALADVTAKVGAGQAVIFGEERSGLGVEHGFRPVVPAAAAIAFSMNLSVGLGRVEVGYG
ncbi:MAG: hypothetical protein HY511_06435 [Actinobacteria bacterium]|nr:hypothetical protein [Actinomycetota bacterium]